MIIEISIAAAVVILGILSYFIITTLVEFKRTLQKVDQLTVEWDIKLQNLNSTLHTISNVGDILENETDIIKARYFERCRDLRNEGDYSEDLADWIVASIRIGEKLLTKKK